MSIKLVIWGADIGYTEIFDTGSFKCIDKNIVTHADVMFDALHAKEALSLLKDRPWISIGWHRHLWERPVSSLEKVPHMIDEDGRFKWRHKHPELMGNVPYQEAYDEFEAQVKFCKKYSGRYPDTTCFGNESKIPLEKAFIDVCNKYKIKINIFTDDVIWRNPKYKYLNYHIYQITPNFGKEILENGNEYDLSYFKEYDPTKTVTSLKLKDDTNYLITWHPGYLDEYILSESSCTIHRVKELQACLSYELQQWIIDNKIELVNERDIVEGTDTFQQHLKEINSPLWIGNF